MDSTKSRYSLASKGDKFSARALCGLADIVVGVTKVAISPFNLFLFGSPKEALFDVVSIPVIVGRSVVCLTGSAKAYDFFENVQGCLEEKIMGSGYLSI